MIHNLELERQRIDEALEVLRRLYQIRKPSKSELDAKSQVAEHVAPEAESAREGKARRAAAGGRQGADEA
jgi:hypothetical protein